MEDRRQDPDDAFDAAAIGALERSPDMRSFSVKRVDWRAFTAHSPFLRRLGHDGAFGERLRSLRLASVKPAGLRSLAKCLAGGRLPCLMELEVVMVSAWESDRARKKERAWAALPRALEKRARLGLAPLTSIKGAAKRAPETLARLWACCPPERITYLEARGVKQARALGEFLLAHPGFAALRTLRVRGQEDRYIEGDAGSTNPRRPSPRGSATAGTARACGGHWRRGTARRWRRWWSTGRGATSGSRWRRWARRSRTGGCRGWWSWSST